MGIISRQKIFLYLDAFMKASVTLMTGFFGGVGMYFLSLYILGFSEAKMLLYSFFFSSALSAWIALQVQKNSKKKNMQG